MRPEEWKKEEAMATFPYFFVGTFIEADKAYNTGGIENISLLFRRDFH